MTTTTGILIDPDALLDARRQLLRHELALGGVRVHPPATGPTTSLTAGALDRVAATVDSVAEDLHGLADALHRLVDDLVDQDGRVSAMFDLLTMRSMA
ncbi:MAG: hypothetical protein WKF50_06550 [Nocardioides sp.]